MPRLKGLELIRVMKKNGRKEKVMLISGAPVDNTLLEESMPVFAHLRKPFRMNQLLDAFVSALESKGSKSKRRKNAA